MPIDSIEILHYRLPLEPPFHASWDPRPRTSHTCTLVRVRAGEHEGVGSGDAMLGFAGHEQLFIGHDPFDIERHVHILDNLQFMYGRMWPLEVALWDLMGKASGLPLWKLMGGRSAKVPLYASCGERRPAAERAASAIQSAVLKSQVAEASQGICQPWLASTRISMSGPMASRTACTTARSSRGLGAWKRSLSAG